jgi:hypothetical protein
LAILIKKNEFCLGTLSKARITHAYFVDDICKCLYKAAENTECHLEMFDDNKKISFGNFSWYYGKTIENLSSTLSFFFLLCR